MASRFSSAGTETDAATLQLGDAFKKAHCLMHSEVLLLLQDIQERRREEAMTLPLPPPSKVFTDCFEYVKTFGHQSNRELVRAVRQNMSDTELREFEMAQVANLTPSTAEEAKQLIPSLRDIIGDDRLQKIIDDNLSTKRYDL